MAGSALRKAHFYRRVPKELTEGSALGGVVSLVGILVSVSLVYSNAAAYFATAVRTKLVLDLNTEDHIELAFNITMDGLPCRFTSVDFFDATGTKRLNISRDIMKVRVSSNDGHILGMSDEEEWIKDVEHDDPDEAHELASMIAEEADDEPQDVPFVTHDSFEKFANSKDLVMVQYGAPWCPWSRRMEPVWKALHMMVATSPLIKSVSLGRVDCTQEKQLCASQQVSAFPTLRVYRQHDTHSHENYHGDRTVEALHEFLQEAVEAVDEAAGFHPLTHLSHRAGEGCQVSGGVLISRVPGSLRLSAQSPQAAHSFDPLVMNATHHVDALLFVPPLFDRASDIEWSTQLHSHSLGAISDPGELRLRKETFVMHEQATTLKHYLKVVPQRRITVRGQVSDTFQYSTNYNEFRPTELKPHAADPMQRLVPNAIFTYDISPYRVVHREEAESLGNFLTQLCAIVGGCFTVFGLIDSVLFHGIKAIKQD
jgi:thiol-disulfide isomerase/thioredoxin